MVRRHVPPPVHPIRPRPARALGLRLPALVGDQVLEVLHEAARRKHGEDSCAMILGTTGFAERMSALAKFKESPACYVLLLAVGACASGLTLTHANHCILLDLQAHEGKELQLVGCMSMRMHPHIHIDTHTHAHSHACPHASMPNFL